MSIFQIIALSYLFYSLVDIFKTIKALIYRDKKITDILQCAKCFSFWLVLATTQNLEIALLVSLCVLILDNFLVTRI